MHGYLCEFILALLIYGDKGVRVLARLLLGPKLLRYVRNLQWAQISFSQSKTYSSLFIEKFLKFEEKFEMWPD